MNVAYIARMEPSKSLVRQIAAGDNSRGPGRPASALNEEQKTKLLELTLKGYPLDTCRDLLGISDYLIQKALKNKDFLVSFKQAESAFMALVQDKVLHSAISSVDGARWLLERRKADEYSVKGKAEVSKDAPKRIVIKRYQPIDGKK
jgi:hypothetical protein